MKTVKLSPVIKNAIWGGTYFSNHGKGSPSQMISELWELSVRAGSTSQVFQEGPLSKYLKESDVGPVYKRFNQFPLLIKLIDANKNLSVQVHPSDDYALCKEDSLGKTEAWYIIDADEGAGIYLGFKKNTNKEEVLAGIQDGTVLELLNFYPVKKGDVFTIESGTVHALGAGVRVLEVQENSDLTYRLFDYNRVDKDGKKRALHIDKSLEVLNFKKYVRKPLKGDVLVDNSHFKMVRKNISRSLKINPDKDSFVTFTFISGEGTVDDIEYSALDTFFVPYGKSAQIKGNGEVIISTAKL